MQVFLSVLRDYAKKILLNFMMAKMMFS